MFQENVKWMNVHSQLRNFPLPKPELYNPKQMPEFKIQKKMTEL